MRITGTATSISWIPSESMDSALRLGMSLGLSHWDAPPPDTITGHDHVRSMSSTDRFRFANVVAAWIEVDDGRVVDAGWDPESGGVMGATTVQVGPVGARFRAVALPTITRPPERSAGSVRFVQTVGGRTGVPLPRPVPHAPFARWQAPTVWTTLALTLHTDGRVEVDLTGASAFPRHWIYGGEGRIVLKSGLTDEARWLSHSFGDRTPWSEHDRAVPTSVIETELERLLSVELMRPGRRPRIRRLAEGGLLTEQGAAGDELFLLLDGLLEVVVDGTVVGQVGPGAILGERSLLEGGRRTSTLRALTPARVAVAAADAIDTDRLRELATGHRREHPS